MTGITCLKQCTIESIAKILGNTSSGLTGSQIGQYLIEARISDIDPQNTKWRRLYNALLNTQNTSQCSNSILNFIKHVMNFSRYVNDEELFLTRRNDLNKILSIEGYSITKKGGLSKVAIAETISEARNRADTFKVKLEQRNVHRKIFEYCNAELLAENYFHSVQEAAKSIFDRLRDITGIQGDGGKLVDAVLSGDQPLCTINQYITESEQSEQRGFSNLLKGLYGMFRNPTAHSSKIKWEMTEEDALDIMAVISYSHKRLDNLKKNR